MSDSTERIATNVFTVVVIAGIGGMIVYFVYRGISGIGGFFGNWLDWLSPAPRVLPAHDDATKINDPNHVPAGDLSQQSGSKANK